MIKSLEIQNFQSHRDSRFDFHPGVNSLIGESNGGKSSALRAFLWAFENRPLGNANVSDWIRDKNDEPTEDMKVGVDFDNGRVVRRKGPAYNGYIVDGQELSAIKTDVPDEVQTLFALSDINVSRQHDMPFLLANTGGEVAKYLNHLIHLERIDTVMAAAGEKRRAATAEAKAVALRVENAERAIAGRSWVAKAEQLMADLKKVLAVRDRHLAAISQVRAAIADYDDQEEFLTRVLPVVSSASISVKLIDAKIAANLQQVESKALCLRLVDDGWTALNAIKKGKDLVARGRRVADKADKAQATTAAKRASFERLDSLVDAWSIVKKPVETYKALTYGGLAGIALGIETGLTKNQFLVKQIMALDDLIEAEDEAHRTIVDLDFTITQTKKDLPAVCPTCGRPAAEEHGHE